jgi:hypothetical protein
MLRKEDDIGYFRRRGLRHLAILPKLRGNEREKKRGVTYPRLDIIAMDDMFFSLSSNINNPLGATAKK